MNYRYHFMARRRLFMALSGLLLLVTIISLATRGLNFGIDFRGGVVLDFTTTQPAPVSTVRAALSPPNVGRYLDTSEQQQIQGFTVQALGSKGTSFSLSFPPIHNSTELAVEKALGAHLSGWALTSDNLVSPTIGAQLRRNAILAVLIATALMTAYLGIRFQMGSVGRYSGLKFALAAVLALLHDITLTIGLFSVFHLQVNSPFVAAILTVYGYSMNDTIIVFDRIRERLQDRSGESLVEVIDVSVNQVLNRTLRTVATVLLALLSVYFLGGASTRDLALALLVGVSFGTYSSVFIASPIFLWLVGNHPVGGRRRAAAPAAARG